LESIASLKPFIFKETMALVGFPLGKTLQAENSNPGQCEEGRGSGTSGGLVMRASSKGRDGPVPPAPDQRRLNASIPYECA